MADEFVDQAADYYQRRLGLEPHQARGAARYMFRNESAGKPDAVNPSSGALGIAQWLGPRKSQLIAKYGDTPSLDQQLDFSVGELVGPERKTLDRLRTAKTEGEAYGVWGKQYERPGAPALAKAGVHGDPLGLSRAPAPLDQAIGGGARQPPPHIVAMLDALVGGKPAAEEEPHPKAMLDTLIDQVRPAPLKFLDQLLATGDAKPSPPRLAEPYADRPAPLKFLDQLIGMGDPEAKGAAEASRAMEPAVTDLAQKGIAGELGMPSALERLSAPGTSLVDKGTDVAMSFGPGSIKAVGKAIESILSPTTVDATAKAGEALIRKETGLARRQTEIANAQVEPLRAVESPHLPDFNRHIAEIHAGNPNANPSVMMDFLDYVEGRSTGKQISDPHMQPIADTLRNLVQERRAAIASEPTTAGTSFIEDYFPHIWKDAARAPSLLAGARAKQGTAAPLRRRKIPTMREGIEAGLTPASPSAIETTMRYIQNMDQYLAHNRVFDAGRQSGMIKFVTQGGKVPDGWARLQGRLAGPKAAGQSGLVTQAYAPDGFARIYNNFIDPGFYSSPLGSKIYDGLLRFTNTLTAAKLGFSGYHALAMAQETAVSGLAKAFGEIPEGELASALKDAGFSIAVVPKVAETAARGRRLQRQYLEMQDYGPDYAKAADLLAKGGGRPIGRGAEYRGTTALDNYWKAWRRGTLKTELAEGARGIEGPVSAGKFFFREYARTMDTVAAPLFDQLIPKLKTGAYFDEMSDWLRQNPGATPEAQMARSRELVDVVDDRFGEMIMDNIFWNKRLKQSLQVLATSVGWELGSARALGGGAKDLLSGKWSPRTRWLLAFPVVMATTDAAYQYLRTGKPPEGVKDLAFPQTGGTTPEGAPELAMVPGYGKDVLGVWTNIGRPLSQGDPAAALRGVGNELYQKRNPAIQLMGDLLTGKDWRGKDIASKVPGAPAWYEAYAKRIGEAFLPIPLAQDKLKGTAIGTGERFLGVRPVAGYIEDPERDARMRHKIERSQIRRDRVSERRWKNRLEGGIPSQ